MFHKDAAKTDFDNQDRPNELEIFSAALNNKVPLTESLDQYRLFVRPEARDVNRLEGQYLEDFLERANGPFEDLIGKVGGQIGLYDEEIKYRGVMYESKQEQIEYLRSKIENVEDKKKKLALKVDLKVGEIETLQELERGCFVAKLDVRDFTVREIQQISDDFSHPKVFSTFKELCDLRATSQKMNTKHIRLKKQIIVIERDMVNILRQNQKISDALQGFNLKFSEIRDRIWGICRTDVSA
jgi:hypothetical protein